MGQIARQPKYNKIWDFIDTFNTSPEDGGTGYHVGIEMLLRFMSDEQLDMVIAEIEKYCEVCMTPGHSPHSCPSPLVEGCPCCESTRQNS